MRMPCNPHVLQPSCLAISVPCNLNALGIFCDSHVLQSPCLAIPMPCDRPMLRLHLLIHNDDPTFSCFHLNFVYSSCCCLTHASLLDFIQVVNCNSLSGCMFGRYPNMFGQTMSRSKHGCNWHSNDFKRSDLFRKHLNSKKHRVRVSIIKFHGRVLTKSRTSDGIRILERLIRTTTRSARPGPRHPRDAPIRPPRQRC